MSQKNLIKFRVDTVQIDPLFPQNKRIKVVLNNNQLKNYTINWYEKNGNKPPTKFHTGPYFDYIPMDANPGLSTNKILKRIYVQIETKTGKRSELKEAFSYIYYIPLKNKNNFNLE